MKRIRGCAALVLSGCLLAGMVCAAGEAEESLAARLPSFTAMYLRLDIGAMLEIHGRMLDLADPEAAKAVHYSADEMKSVLAEYAAAYEMKPGVVDAFLQAKVYLLMIPKLKPLKVEFAAVPEEGKEAEEGWSYMSTNYVIEAAPVATEALFTEILKSWTEQQAEAGRNAPAYTEIATDSGTLVRSNLDPETPPEVAPVVGLHGQYLVFGMSEPAELWRALSLSPEQALVEDGMFKGYLAAQEGQYLQAWVGVAGLVQMVERSFVRFLNTELTAEEPGSAAAENARAALQAFQQYRLVKQALGLDRIVSVIGSLGARENDEGQFVTKSQMVARFADTMPPLFRLLIDSGRKLQLPDVEYNDESAILGRLDVAALLEALIDSLPIAERENWDVLMAVMREQIGTDLHRVLGIFSGDAYLFYGLPGMANIPFTVDGELSPAFEGMPPASLYLGVKDAESARTVMGDLLGQLSTMPPFSLMIKKEAYQERTVWRINPLDPQKKQMHACLAVVDRYLVLGGWEDVTRAIRTAGQRGAPHPLQAVADRVPRANLITITPRSLARKLQELFNQKHGDDADKEILDWAAAMPLAMPDPKMQARFKEALVGLVSGYLTLAEKLPATNEKYISTYGMPVEGDRYAIRAVEVFER